MNIMQVLFLVGNPRGNRCGTYDYRRKSFRKGFESICQRLKLIAEHNSNIQIVYLMHMNPNVRGPVYRILEGIESIHLIALLINYAQFVFLMKHAYLILTDSVGIQKEAPSLGKPVLVMCEKIERPKAIGVGTTKLVGTESEAISTETQRLLDNTNEYDRMVCAVNPFGNGKAAHRIVKICYNRLNGVDSLRGVVGHKEVLWRASQRINHG